MTAPNRTQKHMVTSQTVPTQRVTTQRRDQIGRGPGTFVLAVGLAAVALATHLTDLSPGARTATTALCLLVVPGLGLLAWLPPLTAELRAATALSGSFAVVTLVSVTFIGLGAYRPGTVAVVAIATGLVLFAARLATHRRTHDQGTSS
jgi:uncharacterized membrane protein